MGRRQGSRHGARPRRPRRPEPRSAPRRSRSSRRIYEGMLRTRLIDVRLTKLQRQGRIGFHVGCRGRRGGDPRLGGRDAASRTGSSPATASSARRCIAGFPLQRTSTTCSATRTTWSRAGRCRTTSRARDAHFGSISSPIGTQITQAVGFAWAAKIKQAKTWSSPCYFGDGATSSNDFHSGMNFAGVFQAPIVFFCATTAGRSACRPSARPRARTFADKGVAYGVPGVRCDGNDVFAVYARSRKAVERAAARRGPDADRAHHLPHGRALDQRRPDRVPRQGRGRAPAATRDPLRRMRTYLEHQGAWTEQDEKRFDDEVQRRAAGLHRSRRSRAAADVAACSRTSSSACPRTCASSKRECVERPRARKNH